jgi:hypothetical protein
LALKK